MRGTASSLRCARVASGLALFATLARCSPPPPNDAARDADASDGAFEERADAPREGGSDTCPRRGADSASNGTVLVVGTGRDGTLEDFRPLASDAEVFVAPGEQGLQHVVIALRGSGFDPSLPLLEARLLRASDCAQVGFLRFRLPFRRDPADPSRFAVEAIRVVLQDDLDPFEFCTVLGQPVDLLVTLDDLMGRRAHRELRLRVAGIDPTTRPDVREAYLRVCAERGRDAGAPDASLDASADVAPADASDIDASPPDASALDARGE